MALTTHRYCDDAFSVFGLMSEDECKSWIAKAENTGFEIASIKSSVGYEENSGARSNSRVLIDDHSLADLLWNRVRGFVPEQIGKWRSNGLNERFRIYRYEKGQQFRKHSDGKFQRSATEESRLTFMAYLNQDFQGGGTDFGSFTVWPETGMGLCFKHSLPHEGAIITEGVKYVLRSDIMYASNHE